jgi:hypothetical protein
VLNASSFQKLYSFAGKQVLDEGFLLAVVKEMFQIVNGWLSGQALDNFSLLPLRQSD